MRKFRVLLTASASVHGYIEVEAKDPEEAKKMAVEKSGDVSWEYDGTEDSSIEAVAADPA